MEEIKDLVTFKVTQTDDYKTIFVDFRYEPKDDGNTPINEFGPNVYSNQGTITEKISETDVKGSLLNSVYELAETNFNSLSQDYQRKFIVSEDNERLVVNKINNVRNFIACEGRVGPGSIIVISQEMIDKYTIHLPFLLESCKLVIADVRDIYIYRCNQIDQPGLVFIHNDEKCQFHAQGFNPEKQFMKVKIDF